MLGLPASPLEQDLDHAWEKPSPSLPGPCPNSCIGKHWLTLALNGWGLSVKRMDEGTAGPALCHPAHALPSALTVLGLGHCLSGKAFLSSSCVSGGSADRPCAWPG